MPYLHMSTWPWLRTAVFNLIKTISNNFIQVQDMNSTLVLIINSLYGAESREEVKSNRLGFYSIFTACPNKGTAPVA